MALGDGVNQPINLSVQLSELLFQPSSHQRD
jgi:hypothetical protein